MPDQKRPYLKEFHAHSVWGKYEFHLKLNDGVNFISGLNGSNKSTLLYLIYGSLVQENKLKHLGSFVTKIIFSDHVENAYGYFSKLNEKQATLVQQVADEIQTEQQIEEENEDMFQFAPFSPDFVKKVAKPLTKMKHLNVIIPQVNIKTSLGVNCLKIYNSPKSDLDGYQKPDTRICSPVLNETTIEEKNRVKKTEQRKPQTEIDTLLFSAVDKLLAYEFGLFEQAMENKMANWPEISEKREALETLINSFFNETGKKMIRNDEKEIAFELSETGQTLDVIDLSHGEKSLLYMLLTVFLEQDKVRIFLFDEPETALHLSWQKKLPDALITLAPDCQFILTTHSPGIVSGKWLQHLTDMSKIRTLMADDQ